MTNFHLGRRGEEGKWWHDQSILSPVSLGCARKSRNAQLREKSPRKYPTVRTRAKKSATPRRLWDSSATLAHAWFPQELATDPQIIANLTELSELVGPAMLHQNAAASQQPMSHGALSALQPLFSDPGLAPLDVVFSNENSAKKD